MSFIGDIQGHNTQLYPIVTIEPPDITNWKNDFNRCTFLSTNNVALEHIHVNTIEEGSPLLLESKHFFKPILLNIPSIKESIDIESRKFKISNVSLDISNIEYGGQRFTDILSDTSLINWLVSIQFVSPSAHRFSTIYGVSGWIDPSGNAVSFYDGHTGNHNGFGGVPAGVPATQSFDLTRNDSLTRMVYQGVIRRISHDDTKVKISIEDLTEQKAHENLPSESLGSGDDVPDRYKNKPIPMVYGHVDKSPLVADANYNILRADYKELQIHLNRDSGFKSSLGEEIYLGALMVDTGDEVLYISEWKSNARQWEYINNYFNYYAGNSAAVKVKPIVQLAVQNLEEDLQIGQAQLNSGLLNEDFLMTEYADSTFKKIIDGEQTQNTTGFTSTIKVTAGTTYHTVFSYKAFEFSLDYNGIGYETLDGVAPYLVGFQINNLDIPSFGIEGAHVASVDYDTWTGIEGTALDNSAINQLFGFKQYYQNNSGWNYDVNPNAAIQFSVDNHVDGNLSIHPKMHIIIFRNDSGILRLEVKTVASYDYQIQVYQDETIFYPTLTQTTSLEGDFNEIELLVGAIATDFLDKGIYANLYGRINTFTDHPISVEHDDDLEYFPFLSDEYNEHFHSHLGTWQHHSHIHDNAHLTEIHLIENPIDIIYDLVRSELRHDAINEAEYIEARNAHLGWKFGFTITKKINSKKLIEEIAKSTKCFPKFKNDGTFGFNTIKNWYTCPPVADPTDTDNDYAKAHLIKESEVISYSFKQSKPEQIYQKVDVQYNKDYEQNSYLKRTGRVLIIDAGVDTSSQMDSEHTTVEGWDALISNGGSNLNSDSSYYGFQHPVDGVVDNYLEFESPYIRNLWTAWKLGEFLAEHHRNNHLLLNIKLPLQYINLEIGDLVKFRELLGGVKAYGIDYRVVQRPNHQDYYPLFMITSTTKNLDSVSIECMQLHHLGNQVNDSWFAGTGADDTEGTFYFPDAGPIISDVDVTPFVITPPVISGIEDMNLSTHHTYIGTSIDVATATDGDQDSTDISHLVQIVASTGDTFSNIPDGNNMFFLNDDGSFHHFHEDTQVLVTYSVTSPTTGMYSEESITINIDVETRPVITVSPLPMANISVLDGWLEFIHNIPLEGNEGVDYFEKYVFNTSEFQEIDYHISDEEDGDITNNAIFFDTTVGLETSFPASFTDIPLVDLFELAQNAADNGDSSYTRNVGIFAIDSVGQWDIKRWKVNIQLPEVPIEEEIILPPWEGGLILGDVNYDGAVYVLDIVLLVQYLNSIALETYDVSITESGLINADINQDGEINILDVVGLVNIILDS